MKYVQSVLRVIIHPNDVVPRGQWSSWKETSAAEEVQRRNMNWIRSAPELPIIWRSWSWRRSKIKYLSRTYVVYFKTVFEDVQFSGLVIFKTETWSCCYKLPCGLARTSFTDYILYDKFCFQYKLLSGPMPRHIASCDSFFLGPFVFLRGVLFWLPSACPFVATGRKLRFF